jgi:hypothetical protein
MSSHKHCEYNVIHGLKIFLQWNSILTTDLCITVDQITLIWYNFYRNYTDEPIIIIIISISIII